MFERWSPPYTDWARRMGRPLVPEGSAPECPVDDGVQPGPEQGGGAGQDGSARITYPFDGARFVIDPDRPLDLQVLEIQAEPGAIELQVDGKPLPKNRTWPLVEGTHTITIAGVIGAAPVHFTVRR